MPPTAESRFLGCLLGLACGDAVGTTVEFQPRGTFDPVTDMVGGGPFQLHAGQWTDDTSLALCLAESLVRCRGFDPRDQMERYVRWWMEGYWSSTGFLFDIGSTIYDALSRFKKTGDPFSGPTDPMSAGNGSLMRLAPVPMYYAQAPARAVHLSGESSRTTHGATEAIDACRYYGELLTRALAGADRDAILEPVTKPADDGPPYAPKIAAVAEGAWRKKSRDEIHGKGYVVLSLEAALWCFHTTRRFEDAILSAANLGDDADTTAAITGQLAGAHYGVDAIPKRWLGRLTMREEIEELARGLMAGAAG